MVHISTINLPVLSAKGYCLWAEGLHAQGICPCKTKALADVYIKHYHCLGYSHLKEMFYLASYDDAAIEFKDRKEGSFYAISIYALDGCIC
jgi:hypothetical protein